jgi:tetratricopeptide (TPR) repeat protein
MILKKIVLITFFAGVLYISPEGNTMFGKKGRYFSEKELKNGFAKEMVSSQEVFESMQKSGLKEYQFCEFDFNYISDKKDKLDSLSNFLKQNYGYKMEEIKKIGKDWDLSGIATKFPVDADNMLYWAIDLYLKGYNYDCKLDGYGAIVDTKTPSFIDLNIEKADYYFNEALKAYNNKNLGLAIIYWSTTIKIDPKDPNSYYSRAIAKEELYTSKSALRDYDKAIEIAPNFSDALTNRGALKDEMGDYDGAINDYSKAIELKPNDEKAYFNRGNSKYNKGDKPGACEDWKKAKELGADYAEERIREYCK